MRYRFDPRFGPNHGLPVLHFIFMLVFIGALIALIVWAVGSARRGHFHAHQSHTHGTVPPVADDAALREARMRYARGELTREQYLQITHDLGAPNVPLPPPPPESLA
jgi:uncharacterized membrane protein